MDRGSRRRGRARRGGRRRRGRVLTQHVESAALTLEQPAGSGEPDAASDSPIVDRLTRLLRITPADRTEHADAHRAMRVALVISGVRCIVAYVLVPFAVPLVSFLGAVAAPLGILLCLVGIANAVLSIRRFHAADHPRKWVYTAFMAVVLVMLVVAMSFDVVRVLAP